LIAVIFGKKDSGKSTLSKEVMGRCGGRCVVVSPVETIAIPHTEAFFLDDIPPAMKALRKGDVLLVRNADEKALDVVSLVAQAEDGGFTILVDECDRYGKSKPFQDLIHYSAWCDVNIVANTRRYVDTTRLLTSQADVLAFFQTQEPVDREYLRKIIGAENAETVAGLGRYQYLEYPAGTIKKTRLLGL
jgi:hypothetical protein